MKDALCKDIKADGSANGDWIGNGGLGQVRNDSFRARSSSRRVSHSGREAPDWPLDSDIQRENRDASV